MVIDFNILFFYIFFSIFIIVMLQSSKAWISFSSFLIKYLAENIDLNVILTKSKQSDFIIYNFQTNDVRY